MLEYSETHGGLMTEKFTYIRYHVPSGKYEEDTFYTVNRRMALEVINRWNNSQLGGPCPYWMYALKA